jgi:hypothetical protein
MRIARSLAVFILLLTISTLAIAWGPGTHAYIANKLNKGMDAPDTIFGAVAPDINQVLSTDQNSPFFTATHYGFMDLWNATTVVTTSTAKPLAFGFVSHNELWGADHYAHITSNLYKNYVNPDVRYSGQNGYVWVKAAQLCSLMQAQLEQSGQGGGLAQVLLSDPMNCHFIVEYAMDIVLKTTRDPKIGARLINAASNYDSATLGNLFLAGYTAPIPPVTMGYYMNAGQPAWAGLMFTYGTALNQPTLQKTITSVDAFLEFLAENLLGAQIRAALGLQPTDPIPDAVKAQLLSLIDLGIKDSLVLCALDYNLELDLTLNAVRKNMTAHGIYPTK